MTDALDATAVEAVAKLAVEAAGIVRVGSYDFGPEQLRRLDVDPRAPAALEFETLEGFAQFCLADRESLGTLVHVVSRGRVCCYGPLDGEDKHLRPLYAEANYQSETLGFRFNAMGSLEGLTIALQTCFAPEAGRIAELRKFCASIRSTNEIGVADDGVSQTVQAKKGVAAIMDVPVANPWALAPFRTFAEIEQPVSDFVLRFKEEGQGVLSAGLYEVGDTSWRAEAVRRIAAYLRAKLGPDWQVLG